MTDQVHERDLAAVEARLRRALDGHTAHMAAGDDVAALALIEARLRTTSAVQRRRKVALGVMGVAAALVVLIGLPSLLSDDDRGQVRTVAPDPREESTTSTSTAVVSTVAPEPAPPSDAVAVWPPEGGARFSDPMGAVRSLVEEYVGIPNPLLTTFRAVDATSGEVDVSARSEDGSYRSLSTVSVRRFGEDWAVTSARSPDIVVENPLPLDTVGSPVVIDGKSRGYEGTIVVDVREAGMGAGQTLGTEPAIAGSREELLPFHIELTLAARSKPTGSILLNTDSGLDAAVQFTIVPVRFGPTPTTGPQVSDETKVEVAWVDAGGTVVTMPRTVRKSGGVLRGAIQELLSGPYTSERYDDGLASALANEAAAVPFQVTVDNGTAVVDFGTDLPTVSPVTSSSAASQRFLLQLHATVFQFPTVTRAEYRVGGSCEAFWAWLQRGCTIVDRTHTGV